MEFHGTKNAEGRIVGGNLTHFAVLLGSKYFPKMKNNILLLEDVMNPPTGLTATSRNFSTAGYSKRLRD
jgi:muramoyltetrapeptide carboxypeptidase LdcA involved in peptidoglycan recycling